MPTPPAKPVPGLSSAPAKTRHFATETRSSSTSPGVHAAARMDAGSLLPTAPNYSTPQLLAILSSHFRFFDGTDRRVPLIGRELLRQIVRSQRPVNITKGAHCILASRN